MALQESVQRAVSLLSDCSLTPDQASHLAAMEAQPQPWGMLSQERRAQHREAFDSGGVCGGKRTFDMVGSLLSKIY